MIFSAFIIRFKAFSMEELTVNEYTELLFGKNYIWFSRQDLIVLSISVPLLSFVKPDYSAA